MIMESTNHETSSVFQTFRFTCRICIQKIMQQKRPDSIQVIFINLNDLAIYPQIKSLVVDSFHAVNTKLNPSKLNN